MFVFSLLASAFAGNYAILFAGSDMWYNYRHQADILTIYSKLIANGYQESEIVLCAYDDIAYNRNNPFKGQIFHDMEHSSNVYPGSEKINYKGDDVTAQTFYNAIKNAPVTTDDYLFIYYDNHGGPGVLGVPSGSDILASDLAAAIATLDGKCKAGLFGIEACYAGSVAEVIKSSEIGVITAANNAESSYAAVYDSVVGTYLSNEFTNYWIDEMFNNPDETVGELFENVKKETVGSHASAYCAYDAIKDLPISNFFKKGSKTARRESSKVDIVPQKIATLMQLEHLKVSGRTSEIRRQARLELLKMSARSEKLEIILDELIKMFADGDESEIRAMTSTPLPKHYPVVLQHFIDKFGKVNPDDYGRFMIIKNLCAKVSEEEMIKAIDRVL